jgi:hypothetical protein
MKSKMTLRLWQVTAVLAAALLAFSCEKPETPEPQKPPQENPDTPGNNDGKDEPEEQTFDITGPTSEFYKVEFPESAKEGEDVTVTVIPVDDVTIVGVRYNSKKAELIEENVYKFTMPKKNVELTVESSSTVTVVESCYFKSETDKKIAQAGDLVTVVFYVNNIEDMIASATVNGTIKCKLEKIDLGEYTYSFTMPEGPAVVEAQLASEYHIIEREWDEHCRINMLDCINNQGTPEEFCSQKEEGIVHFIYRWDLGYDVICTVTGMETGKDYTDEVFWSLASDNHLYQDCWAFYMPDEPVLIKAVSTERNAYEGTDFVGEYAGYWITDGENLIYSSSEPTMNLELRKSGAFFVNTTDANAYEFSGIYTVTDGQLASDREVARGDFALRGKILEDGYAFAIVDNILHDNVDNRRFYLVGKNNFEFVCASDKYATRFLLEANEGGHKSWYFIERDNQSISKAEVTFITGSSIGQTCEAMVKVEGGIAFNRTEEFRFTNSNGTSPVFTYIGKEAGTYTSAKGETLVLDGFGKGSYNGNEGTYTIENGIVTFTDKAGKETKMNTDVNNKTFTVITEASEETLKALAAEYKTTTAKISTSGTLSENGTVYVAFDRNYYGDYYKGYAQIKITYVSNGSTIEILGDTKKYVVDEIERTVTFPNVVQGDGINSNTTIKKDVVFKISDDFKTLTLVNDYIYSTNPNDYCIGGAVLNAVEE